MIDKGTLMAKSMVFRMMGNMVDKGTYTEGK